ncbi:MAG: hypothetical protein AAF961_10500 [Planctomycetota bacterium]
MRKHYVNPQAIFQCGEVHFDNKGQQSSAEVHAKCTEPRQFRALLSAVGYDKPTL